MKIQSIIFKVLNLSKSATLCTMMFVVLSSQLCCEGLPTSAAPESSSGSSSSGSESSSTSSDSSSSESSSNSTSGSSESKK